jgi:glycosyltransferase involved in cell wall biosynthesis
VQHTEALQVVKDCDVFLDQFVIGVHGLAALESMSFGKPTVSYINPLMFSRYPADLPVVNANQDTLAEVLGGLLKDGHRRHEVGVQSRAYVEKYHDSGVIAKQLVGIYEELVEKRKQRNG